MSTKKPANEQTSARVASTAAKLLSNPRTPVFVTKEVRYLVNLTMVFRGWLMSGFSPC